MTDPTTSTLNVNWEAAEGNVRQYKIHYVPAAGGVEETVGLLEENRMHTYTTEKVPARVC